MSRRSYRGRLAYLSNKGGETGRETFHVTVHRDGGRTLRASCEMDDYQLLRDVVLSVDGSWRPLDAYVRLRVDNRFAGAAWYSFAGQHARCHGVDGHGEAFCDEAVTGGNTQFFGSHALHNDAWLIANFRAHGAPDKLSAPSFTTSLSANGGGEPRLVAIPSGTLKVIDRGAANVEVPAGAFATRHNRVEVAKVDGFSIWTTGEDHVPVQLASDVLEQRYVLTELEGDVR